jgi:hypothetical protein
MGPHIILVYSFSSCHLIFINFIKQSLYSKSSAEKESGETFKFLGFFTKKK